MFKNVCSLIGEHKENPSRSPKLMLVIWASQGRVLWQMRAGFAIPGLGWHVVLTVETCSQQLSSRRLSGNITPLSPYLPPVRQHWQNLSRARKKWVEAAGHQLGVVHWGENSKREGICWCWNYGHFEIIHLGDSVWFRPTIMMGDFCCIILGGKLTGVCMRRPNRREKKSLGTYYQFSLSFCTVSLVKALPISQRCPSLFK